MHPYGFARDDRWLIGPTSRRIADVAFGLFLLVVGIATLVYVQGLTGGRVGLSGAWSMPRGVAGALAAVGILLVVRGALALEVGFSRWSRLGFGIVAGLGGLSVAMVAYDVWSIFHGAPAPITSAAWLPFAGSFGPPEHFAFQLALLAALVLSARVSRLRALGMLLLGVLLSCVGINVLTGEARLTFGSADLLDGISFVDVAAGLFLVADALLCLASPRLLVALTMRRIDGVDAPVLSLAPGVVLRAAAALVIAVVLAFLYWLDGSLPVVTLIVFTLLGVAARLLGCHRGALMLGLFLGPTIETFWAQAMVISRDDPTIFVRSPAAVALSGVTLALLIAGAVLSLLSWTGALRRGAMPIAFPPPPPPPPR